MAEPGKTRVEVEGDTSDEDIRQADREMAEASKREQGYATPVGRFLYGRSRGLFGTAPGENEEEQHRIMQGAAERGMQARRGKRFVRGLASSLEGALKEEPAPRRRSTKRR